MTDYATAAQLDTHYSAAEVLIAADRDGDGAADAGVIAAALTKATEEIDSYLGVRYTLPLVSVPGILVSACCEVAMYRMSINSPAMTEEKRQRYEDVIKWLQSVAKGLATLGVSEALDPSDDTATVTTTSEVRLFTRSSLAGLI